MLWALFTLAMGLGASALNHNDAETPVPHQIRRSDPSDIAWTAVLSNGVYSTSGFGGSTDPFGSGDTYVGNIGRPYGSNMREVSSSDASKYQYVVKFVGPRMDGWKVVIWNKIGPDGKMDGWYNDNASLKFSIAAGEAKYIAFASDSQGGWTAANTTSIPTDQWGSYAGTWGEFDFGSSKNKGWSGFDVSAIQAQNAKLEVQGMKVCSIIPSDICSYITWGANVVNNAYTSSNAQVGGIGGNLVPGPVRLVVNIDYDI